MPYCIDTDLMLGNLPIASGVSIPRYIQDAADEIDTCISRLYKTPVVFGTSLLQEQYRATILLLKRINSHLASGRMIMALDSSGEETQLHAYGKSLVDGALKVLEMIENRELDLEGADPNTNLPSIDVHPYGIVFQLDEVSLVESFYAAHDPWGYPSPNLPYPVFPPAFTS
jgi:hypothetical protein